MPAISSLTASSFERVLPTSTTTAPSGFLSISGNYTNNGTFTHNSGTTTFDGSAQQTISGNVSGTSAFNNLEVTNTSGSDAQTDSSLILSSALTTLGNFWAATGGSKIRFPASATSTLTNIYLAGVSGSRVFLRSSTASTSWNLVVSGSQLAVTYVDVADSNACSGNPDINASDGTSQDVGGNTCWTINGGAAVTMVSADNQAFEKDQSSALVEDITLTDGATPAITAANNIRIAIATSTHDMRWDSSIGTASASGSAVPAKVPAIPTITYEGGDSVAVVHVDADFAATEVVTVSGLKLTSFNAIASSTSALDLYLSGGGDITSDASDTKTIAVTGTLVLAESAAGQSSNAFDGTEDEILATPLYTLQLTASTSENVSITNLSFPLSKVKGMASGDFTNLLLYIDYDADGTVSAGDSAVGGSGTPSISGNSGTLSFSTTITATTTRDYLLISDINNIASTDRFTIALTVGDITASGVTSSGTITTTASSTAPVTSIRHIRTPGGGVDPTGGDAPAGTIVVGGGSGGGAGEEIGSEAGFTAPTADGSPHTEWTDGSNGYASDGNNATAATGGFRQSYSTFGFSVPGSDTINGIMVKLEASGSTAAGTIDVALSWDTGTSITSVKSTATLDSSDLIFTLGNASDLWGRTWSPSEFSDANFRLRVIAQPSSNTVQVDAIQVKVYHVAGGGGSGGGGEVRGPATRLFAAVYDSVGTYVFELLSWLLE